MPAWEDAPLAEVADDTTTTRSRWESAPVIDSPAQSRSRWESAPILGEQQPSPAPTLNHNPLTEQATKETRALSVARAASSSVFKTPAQMQVEEQKMIAPDIAGVAKGVGDIIPRSVGQAAKMVFYTPVEETPRILKQAYDVVTGTPVEQAIPESQVYKGFLSKPLPEQARIITRQAAPLVMGMAGLEGALKPRIGEPNASGIKSTEPVSKLEVRPPVGEEAPLRQQPEEPAAAPPPAQETPVPAQAEGVLASEPGEILFPTSDLNFRGGTPTKFSEVTGVKKITNDQGKTVYAIRYGPNGEFLGFSENPVWELHENYGKGFGEEIPKKEGENYVQAKETQIGTPEGPPPQQGEIVEPESVRQPESGQQQQPLRDEGPSEVTTGASSTPAPTEVIPRPRAEAYRAAESLEAKDPNIGIKTVNRALRTNAALDDVQHALIQREVEKSLAEKDAAVEAVNSSVDGTPEQIAAMGRLNDAQARFDDAVDASYKGGTATARGLGFRAGTEQFSLSRMLREMQANNGGKRLTPELIDKTRDISERMGAVEKQLTAKQELSKRMDAILKDFASKRASVKDVGATRAATKAFLQDAADRAFARIRQRRAEGRLYSGIDPEALYDHAVIGAHYLAKGVTAFSKWSGEMLKNVGEHIRPFLEDIYQKSKDLLESTMATDKKLQDYKKRLGTNIGKIQEKIDKGDFTKPERSKQVLDIEAKKLLQERDSLRNEWKKELLLRQKVSMPGWRKKLDAFTEYLRAEKLTGLGTLGKIITAAGQRPLASLTEDIAGRVSTVVPPIGKIARGAPTENPILSSYRKYPGGVIQGIKEIPKVLSGKHEPAEYSARGPNVLQYPGRSHGAMKNPIKTAEGELGIDRATKWAKNEKLDLNDPSVEAQIYEFGKQRGLRGIWMNDNFVSRNFRNLLSMIEKQGDTGFVASRLGRILLPIVRVPTNVAIEAGRYHFGLLNASVRLGHALYKGIDNLSPVQKDLIMTNLKKGQVGAGLFALGYIYHDQFGGFYNKETYSEKEKRTGLRPLEAKIFGISLPSWMAHSAAMLTLNAGATFHDMMDKKSGFVGSELAVVRGILENVPFVNELGRIDKMIQGDKYEQRKAIGGWFRSQVFPVIVQEIARWTDAHDANGHPIKRYTQDIGQEIEMGAPGLRERVPDVRPSSRSSGPPSSLSPTIKLHSKQPTQLKGGLR